MYTFSSLREAHHLQTTMDQLPNSELADVHLFYGMANCNSRRAVRMYRERFPNRHVPGHQTFETMHRRLQFSSVILCKRLVWKPVNYHWQRERKYIGVTVMGGCVVMMRGYRSHPYIPADARFLRIAEHGTVASSNIYTSVRL